MKDYSYLVVSFIINAFEKTLNFHSKNLFTLIFFYPNIFGSLYIECSDCILIFFVLNIKLYLGIWN